MKLFLKLGAIVLLLIGTLFLAMYFLAKLNLFPNIKVSEKKILDSIPVYQNATFEKESETGFPASQRIIRDYKSSDSSIKIMDYYKKTLKDLDWKLEIFDTSDRYVPKEIIAKKDKWSLSVLIYSTGNISLGLSAN